MKQINPTNEEKKRPVIKFSHWYHKFGENQLPFECRLLQCFKVHKRDLSAFYIEYDTAYPPCGNYPLPDTDLIVLLLWERGKREPMLLTTIRRYTPMKWKYYKNLIGEVVQLVKSE